MEKILKVSIFAFFALITSQVFSQTTYYSSHSGTPADFGYSDNRISTGKIEVSLLPLSSTPVTNTWLFVVARRIDDPSIWDDIYLSDRTDGAYVLGDFTVGDYSELDIYWVVDYSDNTYERRDSHIVL
ncbi:hypothetical protein EZ428_08325 [Pedobacter frigiditerrae]|uniref:Uncharacterized protein n=1 Tax=Pedobacter frigiditerrae TaxID=2530452 RepID=A0A4R0MX10_9SPHI|nr:hypothetical protein [Pedobacter frigiditerrae]TCC91750.1 hypothetical protein EZ428_08325 [Pedobacter frigiditerrae]